MINFIRFFILSLFVISSAHAESYTTSEYICKGITDNSEQKECIERVIQLAPEFSSKNEGHLSEFSPSSQFSYYLPWLWWLLYYGIGCLVGRYLFRDAKSREWVFLRIHPFIWFVLAVFQPVLTVIAYWAIHYSSLAMSHQEVSTLLKPESKKG